MHAGPQIRWAGRRCRKPIAPWLSSANGVLCAVGLMETGFGRTSIMAKGMNKRRDEKKPKKETPKVIAAAPSTKNVVAATVSKAKGR